MPGENIGVINGATHQVITPTTGWDVFWTIFVIGCIIYSLYRMGRGLWFLLNKWRGKKTK